jgi:hypothetical protein
VDVCGGGVWFLAVFQDFSGSKLSEVNGDGRKVTKWTLLLLKVEVSRLQK